MLACTVQGCGLPLARETRTFVCAAGHSYDIARSGYVSLLQPQDRRSRHAGDSKDALAARAALLEAGVGRVMLDAVAARAAALLPEDAGAVVDLGAGSGELLGTLVRQRTVVAVGIDLSPWAADRAARRYPAITWVVANADRRLPLLDASVDVVVSHHGRRNPAECARVLKSTGRLLVAVPASDDLTELRAAVGGHSVARDRVDRLVQDHAEWFRPIERERVEERHRLPPAQLALVLRGTYRGARHSATPRVEGLETMGVTFASDVVLFCGR